MSCSDPLAPRPLKADTASATPISRALVCEVRFVASRVRLVRLLHVGYLHLASASAYESAVGLLPDGALGSQLPPRLELVSVAEPESGPGAVTLPVRWQASVAGQSQRILDARLAFSARRGWTAVRLDGLFRLSLPSAESVASSDLAQLGLAAACAESLLRHLAEALIWAHDADEGPQPQWHWVSLHGRPAPPLSLPGLPPEGSTGRARPGTRLRARPVIHTARCGKSSGRRSDCGRGGCSSPGRQPFTQGP